MPATQKDQGNRTKLVVGGFVLFHVLCCGLPLLIAAGAFGATGLLVGSPWLITAVLVLAAGVLVWAFRRRSSNGSASGDDCFDSRTQPHNPARDQAEQATSVK